MTYRADRILLVVVALGLCAYLVWRDKSNPIRKQIDGEYKFNLKHVASAQADFLNNDRDGNGVKDYWRADVAGLVVTKDSKGKMIELLPQSVALADDRPKSDVSALGPPARVRGYWVRAILHADETKPDPKRFAVCTFPGETDKDKFTLIVDELNTVWKKMLGGKCADNFPVDPLKEGWKRID